MPRDGSFTLSGLRAHRQAAAWADVRRGRSRVEGLMAQHGAAKLPDLLLTLADLPKAHSVSVHDRCKAVYGQRLNESAPARIRGQSNRAAR